MLVYRLASSRKIKELSGESAKLFGGRWNPPGLSILYTNSTLGLTLYSFSMHMSIEYLKRKSFSVATIEIPDNSITEVKSDGDTLIETQDTRFNIVENWITRGEFLSLKVPSGIVPNEWYVLINTLHPLFDEVKFVRIDSLEVDEKSEKIVLTKI